MSKQNVHAIVGTGTAPTKVILEGLNDAVEQGDALSIVWYGKPEEGSAWDVVYDYVLDNEVEFTLFYEEGATVPRIFREADNGVVQKVRAAAVAAVKSVAGSGKVLYLWDEDDDDEQVEFVFDSLPPGHLVLELTNGLQPITTDIDIPEPVEPEVAKDPDDEPVSDEDDSRFTKAELEVMAASAVKRYGQRIGAKGTTKGAIIAELFPEVMQETKGDPEAKYDEPTEDDVVSEVAEALEAADPDTNVYSIEDIINLVLKMDKFLATLTSWETFKANT